MKDDIAARIKADKARARMDFIRQRLMISKGYPVVIHDDASRKQRNLAAEYGKLYALGYRPTGAPVRKPRQPFPYDGTLELVGRPAMMRRYLADYRAAMHRAEDKAVFQGMSAENGSEG